MSLRGVFNSVQGIDNTVKGQGDTLGRLVGGTYFSQLKPASFRKVPFVVLEGASQFGRRNALHEYPFRDEPWVEDLGKAARRFELKGFVVGDDVIAQRNTLISALERSGDGELVHPTLGKRNVALMDYVCREVWDRGRYFEFTFRFIEQGKRQFPKAAQRSTADVQESAARTNLKALAAFGLNVVTTLRMGIAGASEGLKQARAWAALATQAQRDATSLVNLATTLPGQFGRLLSRAGSVRTGEALVIGAFVTVETLKIQAAESRAAVAAAAAALDTAGQNLGPTTTDDFVTAAQALALAVRNGAPTPGDAVRALAAMVAFSAVGSTAGAALTVQIESVRMLRRAAAVQLVLAVAAYAPVSSADAALVRSIAVDALDALITDAGDAGNDEVFLEIRALKAAIVADINERGAALPDLTTVTTGASAPSLVLASRLYDDVLREPELVSRAAPRHPAFMPTTFQALST